MATSPTERYRAADPGTAPGWRPWLDERVVAQLPSGAGADTPRSTCNRHRCGFFLAPAPKSDPAESRRRRRRAKLLCGRGGRSGLAPRGRSNRPGGLHLPSPAPAVRTAQNGPTLLSRQGARSRGNGPAIGDFQSHRHPNAHRADVQLLDMVRYTRGHRDLVGPKARRHRGRSKSRLAERRGLLP